MKSEDGERSDDSSDFRNLLSYNPFHLTSTRSSTTARATPTIDRPTPPIVDLTSSPVAKKSKISGLEATTTTVCTLPPLTKKKISNKHSADAYALLWICTHGKGQGRNWKKKELKVIGIYATKDAAEARKEKLMTVYECCGHGDIVVGGTYDDEIDLVVRPVEEKIGPIVRSIMPLQAGSKKAAARKPSVYALLWICAHGKGQGRHWKQKALKVIGVYASKDAAQEKKKRIMEVHECCGHGDILIGGYWEDEIDLVVRAVEEMDQNVSNLG